MPELRKASGWRRSKNLIFIIVSLLTVAVIAGAVWLVWFSSLLNVDRIEISGTKLLTQEKVLAAAATPLGTPQINVDAEVMADRIAGLSAVEKVQVSRVWPDAIEISIVERTAKMAISYQGGYLVADDNGVVFTGGNRADKSLPVRADPTKPEILRACNQVVAALSDKTAKQLDYVQAATIDSITLKLSKDITVNWGTSTDSELKSQVLDALLPQGGKHFDVSAPSNPTHR